VGGTKYFGEFPVLQSADVCSVSLPVSGGSFAFEASAAYADGFGDVGLAACGIFVCFEGKPCVPNALKRFDKELCVVCELSDLVCGLPYRDPFVGRRKVYQPCQTFGFY
jgi:hypothetical protein